MTVKQLIIQLLDFNINSKIKYIHFDLDKKGDEHFEVQIFDSRIKESPKEKKIDSEEEFI